MRPGLVFLIVGVLLALSGSAASAAPVDPVAQITYVTPKVSQHGVLTVRASVTPRTTSCTLSLHGPHAQVMVLAAWQNQDRQVQWSYRIGVDAPAGHWTAHVSCGVGMASRAFVVQSPVLKANVAVINSGFTQSSYADATETFISYGAVLHNETADVDADDLNVAVSFTDTLGRSVATEHTTLTGIPAGGSFYSGGLASSNVSLTVAP